MSERLADLGAGRDLVDAVIALDMALHAALISWSEFASLPDRYAGRKGVLRLRRAVDLADLAESPMETRLRLLLIQSGLPRPEPRVNLFDADGRFVARADLYYPSHRLCIEFDGGQHRESLVEDDRRQNLLVDARYSVLRFTSADLFGNQDRVIAMVRGALARPAQGDFSRNLPVIRRRGGDFSRNRPVRETRRG